MVTPVIPTSWQTNRSDLNDALVALLDAFIAAVPDVVRKVWTDVPASLTGEGPFVYLGDITEEITHDSGLRITTFRGTLGYVDVLVESQETNDRINVWADYMRDLFTANARILSTGVLEQTGLGESELTQGSLRMTGTQLSYTYVIQEGRS